MVSYISETANFSRNYRDSIQGSHLDMTSYVNVLTPPMDTIDSMVFSPGGVSPTQYVQCAPSERLHGGYKPSLIVLEEPVERFRFRYKSEMSGTHGSLTGKSSDRARKQTYPTVQLRNVRTPAVVRCSLYQWSREDMSHRRQPHAHRLVRKNDGAEMDDPHSLIVTSDNNYIATFHSMGIIHTAKKYIVPELIKKYTNLKREEIAKNEGMPRSLTKKEDLDIRELAEQESKSINLNIVCLRFEAFEVRDNIFYPIGQPVYSNAINNLKSALTGDLKIVRMDHCTSPCNGGREIFILVEKVTKKNIKVRFYELDDDDNEIWSDYGRFTDLDVHHQYAIVFKTPPYKNQNIDGQVHVYIELERPSDSARSDPKDFTYTPSETMYGRKRVRHSSSYNSSSFSSNELLPLTLKHVNGCVESFQNTDINSSDLNAALEENNLDSREFAKLCEQLVNSGPIENLFVDVGNLQMDGCYESDQDCKPDISRSCIVIRTLNASEKEMLEKVKRVLTSFLRTQPDEKRLSLMIDKFFELPTYLTSTNNTILHLLVIENSIKNQCLQSIIQVLKNGKKTSFLNKQNDEGKTALHFAIELQNDSAVAWLISAGIDSNIQDCKGNTALHLAVYNLPIRSIEMLLKAKCDPNIYNFDGLTSLHLAIKINNLSVCTLLKNNGANVNALDKKNGSTPLHMAVKDGNLNMVQFLLTTGQLNIYEDYGDCSVLRLAKVMIKEDQPQTLQIFNTLDNFMKNKGIFEEVEVKEEIDDDEEEDERMEIGNDLIKLEPMSPTSSMKNRYENVKNFTDETLDAVCDILDKSGNWESLADLLDHKYLFKSPILGNTNKTPSRTLLSFAIASGDTVLQIRDFLENLDEIRAVELIDEMVKKNF